jgi:molybdate transport system ATP-binding protein
MSDALVEIRLRKRLHAELTLEVDLELGTGCSILFGRSGSGKTTTLCAVAGLCRPDAGHVRVGDRVLYDSERGTSLPMRQRRVGMIFQDDLLFPHLSVRENVLYGLAHWPRQERGERLEAMADLFAIGPLLARRPASLSGGEKQRVGLARAIATRPQLLLCDEPISAIDQEGRAVLLAHLGRVQQTERIPVLYVTHSVQEAMALGEQVFVLDHGRVVARGTPLDVFTEPRQLSLARLTRVRNILSATVEQHASDEGLTLARVPGGPVLRVPLVAAPVGSTIIIGLRADDVLLARQPVTGISAQNMLEGRVTEILRHGADVEVLIDCGVRFVASVVPAAVTSLGLEPGGPVCMIIKARSCHLLADRDAGR